VLLSRVSQTSYTHSNLDIKSMNRQFTLCGEMLPNSLEANEQLKKFTHTRVQQDEKVEKLGKTNVIICLP
jgi:hypothetical protein